MAELTGRLHLADSGETCSVALEWNEAARTLHVSGQGVDVRVPAKALSVSAGSGQDAHLVWLSEGRTWAVTLTDRESIRALAGLFAAILAQQLDRAILENLHATRRGRLMLTVLALVVLVGLCFAWLYRGSIADFIQHRRTPAIERQLGQLPLSELSRHPRPGTRV
jgi:hypothetical protein